MGCGEIHPVEEPKYTKRLSNLSIDSKLSSIGNKVGQLRIRILQILQVENKYEKLDDENYIKLRISNQAFTTLLHHNFTANYNHTNARSSITSTRVRTEENSFSFVINSWTKKHGRMLSVEFWGKEYLVSDKKVAIGIADMDPYIKDFDEEDDPIEQKVKCHINYENYPAGKLIMSVCFVPSDYEYLTFKVDSVTMRDHVSLKSRQIYVKIVIGEQIFETCEALQSHKSLPVWKDQTFTFIVPDFLNEGCIEVIEKNGTGSDLILGEMLVDLRFLKDSDIIQTYSEPINIDDETTGSIKFQVMKGREISEFPALRSPRKVKIKKKVASNKIISDEINEDADQKILKRIEGHRTIIDTFPLDCSNRGEKQIEITSVAIDKEQSPQEYEERSGKSVKKITTKEKIIDIKNQSRSDVRKGNQEENYENPINKIDSEIMKTKIIENDQQTGKERINENVDMVFQEVKVMSKGERQTSCNDKKISDLKGDNSQLDLELHKIEMADSVTFGEDRESNVIKQALQSKSRVIQTEKIIIEKKQSNKQMPTKSQTHIQRRTLPLNAENQEESDSTNIKNTGIKKPTEVKLQKSRQSDEERSRENSNFDEFESDEQLKDSSKKIKYSTAVNSQNIYNEEKDKKTIPKRATKAVEQALLRSRKQQSVSSSQKNGKQVRGSDYHITWAERDFEEFQESKKPQTKKN